MSVFDYREGGSPLVVSMPHTGTLLPADLAPRYNTVGHSVCDTDWHIDRLYNFAADLDATVIAARWSRWVIDLNRDPEGAALYPGSFETGLCPTQTFAKEAIYVDGGAPDDAEVARRLETYWRPYHRQLRAALDAAKARHGYALLLDAHSIVSTCPLLFDGRLPDINFGTNAGRSCAAAVIDAATAALDGHDFTHVVDGRFKGGWITRHYGRPAEQIHALQIELAQAAYMDEAAPRDFDPVFAQPLRNALGDILVAAVKAAAPR
jgi:N-formylglutamate deformylase